MTVIVAARLKKGVVIAADAQTTAGWQKEYNDRSKLWVAGQYAFGAAGCVRTSQVVRHFASWPKYRPDEVTDIEAFAVREVVPALEAAVKDRGVVINDAGRTRVDMDMIATWGDHLLMIAGNGAVVNEMAGRCAIGSGATEALGYLGDKGPWTVEQVIEAARRSTLTNLGCSGRIDYVTTNDLTVVRGDA